MLACASEKGGNACIAYADRPHHVLILQAGEWNAARKVLRELESLGHVDEMDLMVSATGDLAAAKALMKGRQGWIFAGGKMNRRKEEFLQFALYSGWNIHDKAPELPVEIRNGQPGMENIVFNGRECLVECSLRPSVKRLE